MNEQELERQSTLEGLLNDPGVPITDVIKLIEQDQALTERILTMANSAGIAPRRRVTSLRQAVVLIGFRNIRRLIERGRRPVPGPGKAAREGNAGA
jgi:c-di-GMP-related signal transduction protein